MNKLVSFVLILLTISYLVILGFLVLNWRKAKYVLSSDTGIIVWGILVLFPITIGVIFYFGIIKPKQIVGTWKKVANDLNLEMPENKLYLKGKYEDFQIEVTADAKRKFAIEGSPAYTFSTISGTKFNKPFPKEFKITSLNYESSVKTDLFAENKEILKALDELKNQKFNYFLFSNEGIFVQNEGIVNDEITLKQMILKVKKLSEAIYKSSP